MNAFSQQGCSELIKSDSEYIYNAAKCSISVNAVLNISTWKKNV